MTADEPTLRVGQVAAAAGVHRETLRYYERLGLLEQPVRSSGGHRLYPASVVITVRAIKAAQRLGFTLDQVSPLLPTARRDRGRAPQGGLQAQTRAKLVEVGARIADLQSVRESLVAALAAGCDDLVACAAAAGCPLPFRSGSRGRDVPGSDAPCP